MPKAGKRQVRKREKRRRLGLGSFWVLALFMAATRIALSGFANGPGRFWHWVQTDDGIAFSCLAAIVLILSGLWGMQRVVGVDADVFTQVPVSASYVTDARAENPVVARIGRNRVLRLSDVEAFAVQEGRLHEGAQLTAAQAFDRGLVSAAVDQLLLANAAQAAALPSQPQVRAQLMTARNRILSANYLEQVIASAATEDKARALYAAQREEMRFGDEIRLRQIIVDNVDQAVELSNLLRDGVSFAQLARDHSTDRESGVRGGDLGYFTYQQLPPAYAERAYEAGIGEPLTPIQIAGGWVILEVTGRRSVVPPSYASLEGELMEYLRLRAVNDVLVRLRQEGDVVLYEPGTDSTPGEAANIAN